MTVFPYRQPSLRGEGAPKGRIGHRRYEREREGAFQVDDLRKHPIHRSASIFYKGRCPKVVGIAIWGNAFPTYGGANPVSLRSTAPSRGRGENVGRFECINPSFLWKEVPAGRRLGDAERSEKGASQAGDLRKHPSAADAVPLPRWGRQISGGFAAK